MWMMDELIRWDRRMFKALKPIFLDKSYTPLQAADFVMWEQAFLSKSFLANNRQPVVARESFTELTKTPHDWGVMNKDDIIGFCEEFGVPKVGELRAWTPLSRLKLHV
jgi:hypothetical protein